MDRSNFERIINWYTSEPSSQAYPSSYDQHISGPYLGGNVRRPTLFHTFACLYPDKGGYCAFGTGEAGHHVSADELRQIISAVEIAPEAADRQRTVAHLYVSPETSEEARWQFAQATATVFGLPIGFYAIGNTLDTNERAVYLRVIVTAPLERVVAEFKRAAPVA